MKLQLAIVIGAILVGSLATVSMVFIQDNSVSTSSFKGAAGMLGHVTLTAVNEEGNVIAYRQTDNVVINGGDNCLIEDAFGADTTCQNTTNLFNQVHIGSAQTTFAENSGTALGSWVRATGGTAGSTVSASGLSGASTTITAAFLDVSATVAEAALYNGALSSTDVIALNSFTPIVLGATDDLTIAWTITIDGN